MRPSHARMPLTPPLRRKSRLYRTRRAPPGSTPSSPCDNSPTAGRRRRHDRRSGRGKARASRSAKTPLTPSAPAHQPSPAPSPSRQVQAIRVQVRPGRASRQPVPARDDEPARVHHSVRVHPHIERNRTRESLTWFSWSPPHQTTRSLWSTRTHALRRHAQSAHLQVHTCEVQLVHTCALIPSASSGERRATSAETRGNPRHHIREQDFEAPTLRIANQNESPTKKGP